MTTEIAAPPAPASGDHGSRAEHRRILAIIGALMLGMILASLDQTIVSTALPTIAGDLHGLNHLSWVVTAYLLASTVSTPLWGKLGDLYGRKKLYQLSIVIFLAGSMLAGLSQQMVQLIACRAVQGVGAGGLMVGAQAIIGDVVPPRQRGRYMGYFGAVFGITSVAGPLAGGFFTQDLSWRWVFYINVPVGVLALFVIAAVLHVPATRVHHKLDLAGTALLSAGVTAIILVTTWGGTTYHWSSPTVVGLSLAGVALIAAFVAVEARAAEPLIPLGLFRNATFVVVSAVGFVIGCAMFGAIVYLPLYLQTVHGATPTASGLELLPMVGGMLCTFIVSGRLVTSTGRYKIFPILGTAVLTGGLLLLSLLGPATSYPLTALYMLVVGLGVGLVMQVLVVAAQNAVPYAQLGTATSTSTFFRTIGGVFGVSALGALFSNRLLAALTAHASAAGLRLVQGGSIVLNPAQIDRLPPAQRAVAVDAFSHALQSVFLWTAPVVALAFVLALVMKEIPLRTSAGTPAGAGAGDPTGEAPGDLVTL